MDMGYEKVGFQVVSFEPDQLASHCIKMFLSNKSKWSAVLPFT